MMKDKDYIEKYKSRTEEIKEVLRKDDQNTIDYKLYDEAVFRATEDKRGDVLVTKWFYEILACVLAILIPSCIIAYFTGYTFILGCGALLTVAIAGIRGVLIATLNVSLNSSIALGNPHANGKIPTTKNFYLRKYVNEYKVKAESIFIELKKDEQKSLDAIAYDDAAADSIMDIDMFTPLKHITSMSLGFALVFIMNQIILSSGNIKDIVQISTFVISMLVVMIYYGMYYPYRVDIRATIRKNNPYRIEK